MILKQMVLRLGPGLLLLGVGVLLPDYLLFFGGAGVGWIVVSPLVLRGRVRMEYQAAIRHLRRNEYEQAIAIMDRLIQAEPDQTEHRRFRAELHRLSGDLPSAARDYERIVELAPDAPEGYAGLSEVCAQQGDYEQARTHGLGALERGPGRWMPAYNLGMIEDRLGHADAAAGYLEKALAAGLPHRRYRLLARLWLARSYYRQGRADDARAQIALMRQQASGLREWRVIFQSEQAAPLRGLLEADADLAEQLLNAEAPLEALGSA
jgi:tetratricopeptide (TPR) repeat protein